MIYATAALVAVLTGIGIFLYRIGKKAEQGDSLREKSERNEQKARIHDRVDNDADFNSRVSDRFNG